MISIASLWAPILLSGVLVFFVSSIIHMLLPYHRSDYSKVPGEDAAMSALRPLAIPPGDYMMPHGSGPEAMKSEEFQAKVKAGPIVGFTVFPPDAMTNMGKQLGLWFVYALVISVFAAYVAGRTLPASAEYLEVFRLTGTVAFAGYALALPQRSIWFYLRWSTTLKSMFDGLLYALVTAGCFGWLWPG